MSEHAKLEPKRLSHIYNILVRQGAVSGVDYAPAADIESAAKNVVLSIHSSAEAAVAPNEKTRKERVLKALAHRSYMLPYIENASPDELRDIMRGYKWSDTQSIDTVAGKGVKFFIKMDEMPREEGYELSEEAVANSTYLHVPEVDSLKLEAGPVVSLHNTVIDLAVGHRMNRLHAQGLIHAFGKAYSSAETTSVVNTVTQAVQEVLTRCKFHLGSSESFIRSFCETYLATLSETIEDPNFEKISRHAWKSVVPGAYDDAETRRILESEVAHQLEQLYPAPPSSKK